MFYVYVFIEKIKLDLPLYNFKILHNAENFLVEMFAYYVIDDGKIILNFRSLD